MLRRVASHLAVGRVGAPPLSSSLVPALWHHSTCSTHSTCSSSSSSSPTTSADATTSPSSWEQLESRFLDDHHQQQQDEEGEHQQEQHQLGDGHQEPGVQDPQRLLRQVLRKTHAAEAAMAHVLAGQQLVLRGRPDAAWQHEQEQGALEAVQPLLPRYRVRPSALLSLLQAAGVAAGAAAALAPRARDAAIAALQESLTDLYNDQLRLLREAGLSDEAADVRAVLIRLRDLPRAAEGAAPPPDLLSLQQAFSSGSLAGIGVTGVLAAAVKAAADAAIAATGRV